MISNTEEGTIGWAVASPDQFYNQDPTNATFWIGDENDASDDASAEPRLDDPSAFDFSFSEDDLLPASTRWGASSYTAVLPPERPIERDRDKMYSVTGRSAWDPKITIERAFMVSEPTISARSPSPEERKPRKLARTFSGLRKRAKSITRATPSTIEEEKSKDIVADTQNERSKSAKRTRDASRGRARREVQPPPDPNSLSWFNRRPSIDPKKRYSLRGERPRPDARFTAISTKEDPTPQAKLSATDPQTPAPKPESLFHRPSKPTGSVSQTRTQPKSHNDHGQERSKTPAGKENRNSLKPFAREKRQMHNGADSGPNPDSSQSPSSEIVAERPPTPRKSEKRKSLRGFATFDRSNPAIMTPTQNDSRQAEEKTVAGAEEGNIADLPVAEERRKSFKNLVSPAQNKEAASDEATTDSEQDDHSEGRAGDRSRSKSKKRSLKAITAIDGSKPNLTTITSNNTTLSEVSVSDSMAKSGNWTLQAAQRPKDELWPKFRSLEHDYQEIMTTPAGERATTIQSSLIPFLKDHESDRTAIHLDQDNLERRCTILDKWWTELMDLLDDWDNKHSPFRERSLALEAVIGILQRQEWRRIPEFAPLSHKRSNELDVDPSLLQAVYDNIREMFLHNLLRLLSILIHRLSASDGSGIVTRAAGVCCAYAFFFCPGVAENLVRLWKLPSNVIRKVRESVKSDTPSGLGEISHRMATFLPECMRPLRYTSTRGMISMLVRQPNAAPLEVEIDWTNSAWSRKWCGKKTDMFFVFIKHFHALMAELLPKEIPNTDLLCAPGVILVQAQMTIVLKSALMKQQPQGLHLPATEPPSTTFESLLEADSKAVTVTSPPKDALRAVVGRRFVVLLKQVLAEDRTSSPEMSRVFAQSTCTVLKATARQISLFDHDTCFNLCDFLEQSLVVLTKFETETDTNACEGDPAFWSDVFQQMLRSDNTLTALRVFSLLYTTWPDLSANPEWKDTLCHKLILDKDIFVRHFNHWCPVVRVYYMRLLAWCVGRYDGTDDQPKNGDVRILKTLLFRVQESWSYFQYFFNEAFEKKVSLPTTAPANPVPGRRLLIVRLDSPSPTPDPSGVSSPTTKRIGSPFNKEEWSATYTQLFSKLSTTLEDGLEQGRRRSGLFRALSSYRSGQDATASDTSSQSSAATSDESTPNSTSSASSSASRGSLYEQRPPLPLSPLKSHPIEPTQTTPTPTATFKFCFEPVDRGPTADMELLPPRLPHAAQTLLETTPGYIADAPAVKPEGVAWEHAKYTGRALAEWALAVNECQNFFERRRREKGCGSGGVEVPGLGVEVFRRVGQ